jgi:hypothetical protein
MLLHVTDAWLHCPDLVDILETVGRFAGNPLQIDSFDFAEVLE